MAVFNSPPPVPRPSENPDVAEHIAASEALAQVLTNANALVEKLQSALHDVRRTLDELEGYQHPKLEMRVPYHLKRKHDEGSTAPGEIICREIKRINALLGDRA